MKSWNKTICAIFGIVIVETVALMTGHNGTLLQLALILIAGIAGFSLSNVVRR